VNSKALHHLLPRVHSSHRSCGDTFTPLQSSSLDAAAALLKVTPMQLALAWLLRRSPNILLIPGTSSVAHLRENLNAAKLEIPREVLADLDSLGR